MEEDWFGTLSNCLVANLVLLFDNAFAQDLLTLGGFIKVVSMGNLTLLPSSMERFLPNFLISNYKLWLLQLSNLSV